LSCHASSDNLPDLWFWIGAMGGDTSSNSTIATSCKCLYQHQQRIQQHQSTDEAKVTTTEPSPASNNNDLFNCNSNLNSNVGLCLDKVCQWLLGWLLGSCDCFFLCMLVERKCTSFCRFVIRYKIKVFLVYTSQLCNSNNHLAITSFWAQNNSALQQQQLLQQQLLQQAKWQQQQQ